MANSGESHLHHLNAKSEELVKQQLQEEEEGSFSHAMQLCTLTTFSMALQAATELGVFDVIKKEGPEAKLSAKEIAEKLCCKSPESATMLDRLLRLLASHSVVYCDSTMEDHRLYSLAPVAKHFAPNDDGVSFAHLLLLNQDKVYLNTWSVHHSFYHHVGLYYCI